MAEMKLEIVTAERVVYSEDVSVLVAPGADGELGVLPGHAPLLTTLAPGEIKVTKDGEESFIAVSGGFLEVLGNKVTMPLPKPTWTWSGHWRRCDALRPGLASHADVVVVRGRTSQLADRRQLPYNISRSLSG